MIWIGSQLIAGGLNSCSLFPVFNVFAAGGLPISRHMTDQRAGLGLCICRITVGFMGINHLSFALSSGSLILISLKLRIEEKTRLAMNNQDAFEVDTREQAQEFKPIFELKSWLRDIFLAFAIAIFIVVFVVQPVKVEGTSMQPRLADQERIIALFTGFRMSKEETLSSSGIRKTAANLSSRECWASRGMKWKSAMASFM